VMFMPAWRRLDAHCLRVLELAAASELAAAEREVTAPEVEEALEGRIEVRSADLVTLRGRCLARELAFTVEEGRPALVTGPSASGKSPRCWASARPPGARPASRCPARWGRGRH